MANTNTIFGARYWMDLFGATSGKLMPYTVASGDSTALFVGDFVKLTGEASVSDYSALGILPVVTQAAATNAIVGVVEGFGESVDNLTKIYRPASTLRTAWVRVNPYALYIIQSTGDGAAADVGQDADITVGAGSTVTGLSGMQLDHSTLSGSDGQLKIVGIDPGSVVGAYCKFIVLINEHQYKAVAGV